MASVLLEQPVDSTCDGPRSLSAIDSSLERLPWVPEVFGGLPFLSYYFPLPFIVIAVLS